MGEITYSMWHVCCFAEGGVTFKSVVPAAIAFFYSRYISKPISDMETNKKSFVDKECHFSGLQDSTYTK